MTIEPPVLLSNTPGVKGKVFEVNFQPDMTDSKVHHDLRALVNSGHKVVFVLDPSRNGVENNEPFVRGLLEASSDNFAAALPSGTGKSLLTSLGLMVNDSVADAVQHFVPACIPPDGGWNTLRVKLHEKTLLAEIVRDELNVNDAKALADINALAGSNPKKVDNVVVAYDGQAAESEFSSVNHIRTSFLGDRFSIAFGRKSSRERFRAENPPIVGAGDAGGDMPALRVFKTAKEAVHILKKEIELPECQFEHFLVEGVDGKDNFTRVSFAGDSRDETLGAFNESSEDHLDNVKDELASLVQFLKDNPEEKMILVLPDRELTELHGDIDELIDDSSVAGQLRVVATNNDAHDFLEKTMYHTVVYRNEAMAIAN